MVSHKNSWSASGYKEPLTDNLLTSALQAFPAIDLNNSNDCSRLKQSPETLRAKESLS